MSNINDFNNDGIEAPLWKQTWVLIVAGVVVLALIVTAVLLLTRDTGLRFSIEFKDVSGLEVGSGLYLNGLKAGEVTNLTIPASGGTVQVAIKIYPDFRSQMRQGSIFQIAVPASNGTTTARIISMDVIIPTSPQIEPDQVFPGASDDVSALIQIVKMKGITSLDQFKQMVNDNLRLGTLRIVTKFTGGKINRVFVLESGKLIPQDLFFSSILPNGSMWLRSNTSTDQSKVITVAGEFTDISQAVWDKSTLQFTSARNLFWTDDTYTEIFHWTGAQDQAQGNGTVTIESIWNAIKSCTAGDTVGCETAVWNAIQPLIQSAQGLATKSLDVQLSVEMPGKIMEINANSINGDTTSWSFTGAELNQGVTVTAKSRSYNVISFMVVAIILVAIIVVLVVVFRRKTVRKESDIIRTYAE